MPINYPRENETLKGYDLPSGDESRNCPNCGFSMPAISIKCRNCGTESFNKAGSETIGSISKFPTCPKCHAVAEKGDLCVTCGNQLEASYLARFEQINRLEKAKGEVKNQSLSRKQVGVLGLVCAITALIAWVTVPNVIDLPRFQNSQTTQQDSEKTSTNYLVTQGTSVKGMLVQTLDYYCPNISSYFLNPGIWQLENPFSTAPYNFWTQSNKGPLYLQLGDQSENLVQLTAQNTVAQRALENWKCPSQMVIKVSN